MLIDARTSLNRMQTVNEDCVALNVTSTVSRGIPFDNFFTTSSSQVI